MGTDPLPDAVWRPRMVTPRHSSSPIFAIQVGGKTFNKIEGKKFYSKVILNRVAVPYVLGLPDADPLV
jgi:hypothetical protein